jgi:hypothetical protein
MGNMFQKEEERRLSIDERAREILKDYPLAHKSLDTLMFAGCVLLAEFELEGCEIDFSKDQAIVPGYTSNEIALIGDIHHASCQSENEDLRTKADKWIDAVNAVI